MMIWGAKSNTTVEQANEEYKHSWIFKKVYVEVLHSWVQTVQVASMQIYKS